MEIPTPTQQRHQYDTCEQSFPPVLALHGFLAAGDYISMENFFIRHGWCEGSFRVLDEFLSQERFDVVQSDRRRNRCDDRENINLKKSLIGHSAEEDCLWNIWMIPSIMGYCWLHTSLVSIKLPAKYSMLNIYSSADKVVAEASDITADEEDEMLPHVKMSIQRYWITLK